MSPPHVPGVPGTRLPPRDEVHEHERRLRDEVRKKRESLRYVRKNSPPDGTPASKASIHEEAQLLAEISDAEEELKRFRSQKGRRSDTQIRPPPERDVVVVEPEPAPTKLPVDLRWLAYVIPPIVTGVVTMLGTNYIKKEDFEREFKAQREATAALVIEVDNAKANQAALALCLDRIIAQDRRFQVVGIAGFAKLGIVIKGQIEDSSKVDWKSEAIGDPNTGKLPSWSPRTLDGTEILVKTVACPVKDGAGNLFD